MKKFSLKPKEGGKVGKLGSFSLKKGIKQKKTLNSSKLISNGFIDTEKESKEARDILITTAEDIEIKQKEPLVITPVVNESSWEYKRKQILKRKNQNVNEEKEEEFESGTGLVINNSTTEALKRSELIKSNVIYGDATNNESYQRVPVAEFGMAMLRGMGWTEEFEREKRKKAKSRNKV